MKKCIFDNLKTCNDCNDCMVCEYDEKKTCDNCGKCLGIDGLDIRGVKIEELATNLDESKVFEEDLLDDEFSADIEVSNSESINDPIYRENEEDMWEFIDDIKDLSSLIDEEKNSGVEETFPGLISLKKDLV